MEAKELRIGNLVLANGLYDGQIKTVEQIGSRGTLREKSRVLFFKEGGRAGEFTEDCDGIPLTEEWLLKFGFEKDKKGFLHNVRFVFHHIYGWKILENWIKNWVGIREIKYVHELQNLYFALTGKEIELK